MKKKEAGAQNARTQRGTQTSNKQIVLVGNKDVRSKFLHALRNRTYQKNRIIPFPEISRILSWWRIRKEERDDILFELQEQGYLKIVPFHGVILREEGKEK
jgi:hypothetical protein